MDIAIELPYAGSIGFMLTVLRSDHIYFDAYENYRKGSYRNRCRIQNANGVLSLSIPLVHGKNQNTPYKDLKICYSQQWQKMHWTGLTSSYRRSPYFEYYEDEFYTFYHTETRYLLDFNQQFFDVICRILKYSPSYDFSETYLNTEELSNKHLLDYRGLHHPKTHKNKVQYDYPPYSQVFSDRMPFIPDLSILDLLFNKGTRSLEYLQECLKLNN